MAAKRWGMLWLARALAPWAVLLLALAAPGAWAFSLLDRAQLEPIVDGRPGAERTVTLPLHWDAFTRGAGGHALFRFEAASAQPGTAHALLISRVGNSFSVRVNGHELARHGADGDRHADYGKRPRYVAIPAELVQRHNRIEIEVDAQPVRKAGLSQVAFGRADELRPLYESQYRWRVVGSAMLALISAVLGALALLLWLHQREVIFLAYGVSELLWAFAVADTLVERSWLPWPWWGLIVYSAQAVASMLICKFALIVVDRHHGVLRQAIDLTIVLGPLLLAIAVFAGMPAAELLVLVLSQLVGLGVVVVVVRHGWRGPQREQRVLAAAMLALGLVLLRDAYVLVIQPYAPWLGRWGVHYGQMAWLRYTWVGFALVLAWIIAERLRRATQQVRQMNTRLAEALAAREAELRALFARQIESRRNEAMLQERSRITSDLHDGLGSQLLGALQIADNPRVPREVLSQQLRDALDHLKLTVDAMHDTEGDIASLLGALRFRIDPRLRAAGVELNWSVEHLPTMHQWSLDRSRDLQMILFEAFSNLCAHANATRASLRTWYAAESRAVRIVLADNGRGMGATCADNAPGGGRGLANMRARAQRMGAELQIGSSDEGTVIELGVPVEVGPG